MFTEIEARMEDSFPSSSLSDPPDLKRFRILSFARCSLLILQRRCVLSDDAVCQRTVGVITLFLYHGSIHI